MKKLILSGLVVFTIFLGSTAIAQGNVYIKPNGSCNNVGNLMTLFNDRGTAVTVILKQNYDAIDRGTISVSLAPHSKHDLGCTVDGTHSRGWTIVSVQ